MRSARRSVRFNEARLTILAIMQSMGISAILTPSGLVNLPSSSTAPKQYKNSNALSNIALLGAVIQSNLRTFWMPKLLSWRMRSEISDRVISGGVVGRREERAEEGKRRKHLPGEVRPARPARWFREAMEQGVVTSASMPVRGSKERNY